MFLLNAYVGEVGVHNDSSNMDKDVQYQIKHSWITQISYEVIESPTRRILESRTTL